MNTELLKQLGIDPSQIKIKEGSADDFPDYWDKLVTQAHQHIFLTLCPPTEPHWKIPRKTIETIFTEYRLVASWQSVYRQLGNCSYTHKVIRMNFGHKDINRDQVYKTLLHEYVHAITHLHFGRSQKHNTTFKFYLNLLVPLKAVQGI